MKSFKLKWTSSLIKWKIRWSSLIISSIGLYENSTWVSNNFLHKLFIYSTTNQFQVKYLLADFCEFQKILSCTQFYLFLYVLPDYAVTDRCLLQCSIIAKH